MMSKLPRSVLFLGLVLGAATVASAAQANVTYLWTTDSLVGVPGPVSIADTTIQLVVTDAAVKSGSLDFELKQCDGPLIGCISTSGDASGFVSETGFNGFATPFFGSLDVDLIFKKNGTLSGSFSELGDNQDFVVVSGKHNDWSGYIQGDGSPCGMVVQRCNLVGEFQGPKVNGPKDKWWDDGSVQVSEPSPLMLLAVGLLPLFWLRRRALSPVNA